MSEREALSTSLLASVESSVNEVLEDLEGQVRALQDEQAIQVSVGPFGVFNSVTHISHNSGDVPNENGPTEDHDLSPVPVGACTRKIQRTSLMIDEDYPDPSFGNCAVNIEQDSAHDDFGLVDFEGWQDLFPGSLDCLQWTDLFTADAFQELPRVPPERIPAADQLEWPPLQTSGADSGAIATTLTTAPDSTPEALGWPVLNLDADIPLLLQHFDAKVVNQMGALPVNEKSAWRILNYPSAVVTHAKLTAVPIVKRDVTHAGLSNFFAVVAVSAFHLSVNPEASPNLERRSEHWVSLSNQMYESAKYHLGISLASESEGPGKAKYKDQLMAMAAILRLQ